MFESLSEVKNDLRAWLLESESIVCESTCNEDGIRFLSNV